MFLGGKLEVGNSPEGSPSGLSATIPYINSSTFSLSEENPQFFSSFANIVVSAIGPNNVDFSPVPAHPKPLTCGHDGAAANCKLYRAS